MGSAPLLLRHLIPRSTAGRRPQRALPVTIRTPRRIAPWLLLALTLGATPARAAGDWETASAAQRTVSLCAAALDDQARLLARQTTAGDRAAEARLREVLRAGAAWLGRAWREGERDEDQAHALMDEARDQLHGWSTARQNSHAASCLRDGLALWNAATGLERLLLGRVVERRQQRLLSTASAASPASAAPQASGAR